MFERERERKRGEWPRKEEESQEDDELLSLPSASSIAFECNSAF